ncbi:hypothetical protein ILUMI_13091, partial [Ignelater luminosus]
GDKIWCEFFTRANCHFTGWKRQRGASHSIGYHSTRSSSSRYCTFSSIFAFYI